MQRLRSDSGTFEYKPICLSVPSDPFSEIERLVFSCEQFKEAVNATKQSVKILSVVNKDPGFRRRISSNALNTIKAKPNFPSNIGIKKNHTLINKWEKSDRISSEIKHIPPNLRLSELKAIKNRNNNFSDNGMKKFQEELRIEKEKRRIFKSVHCLGKY